MILKCTAAHVVVGASGLYDPRCGFRWPGATNLDLAWSPPARQLVHPHNAGWSTKNISWIHLANLFIIEPSHNFVVNP